MSANLSRAWQLFHLNRFDLAERELHGALAREPNDATAHAMLGYCLARRGEYGSAHESIDQAIGLEPDLAYAHFVKSWALGSQKEYWPARLAILEALRIWPGNTDYLDQLSWIELNLGRAEAALFSAQAGLRLEATHAGCLNCRAMALSHLKRLPEAARTMQQALEVDPLSSRLHTNLGWIYLRWGKEAEAVGHLAEGLRLEPESVESREAFDAGIRTLAGEGRKIILVLAFGTAALLAVAMLWLDVAPRAMLVRLAIAALMPAVAMTCLTASTTFVLQFRPIGRALLAPERRAELPWLNGGLLVATLVGLTVCFLQAKDQNAFIVGAVAAAASAVSVVLYFECPRDWRRVCLLGLIGVGAVACLAEWLIPAGLDVGRQREARVPAAALWLFLFVVLALVVVRAVFDNDPFAALRGLVIHEGLTQRAARPVNLK